jgi:GH24 family phage-related lysozyme (muramidase)
MSLFNAVKTALKQDSPPLQGMADDLAVLSKQVGKEMTDAQYLKQELGKISNTSTLNRDGSLRSPTQEGPVSIPSFQKYKASNDVRGLADAVRNVRGHKFDTSGGGIGAGILEEALGKPAWKHSGRQVQVVNMSPTEYLAKSAKGHGMEYEELLKQLSQGDRLDSVIDGMSEGKVFAAPHLDYRGGAFGQEGQHRAYAAAMMGQDKIPVAVLWDDVKKIDLGKPGQVDIADPRAMAEMGDTPKHVTGDPIAAANRDESLIAMMNAELGRGNPDEDILGRIVEDVTGQDPRLQRRDAQGFTEEQFYHSTAATAEFEEKGGFRPFSHFGTKKAAEDRFTDEVKNRGSFDPGQLRDKSGAPRTVPAHLNIQNPLQVRDNGLVDAHSHMQAAIQGLIGKIPEEKLENYVALFKATGRNEEQQFAQIRRMLEAEGYDGMKYVNMAEDAGSESLIAIRPQQVRSPNAEFKDPKSGNIMAGTAGAAVVGTGASLPQDADAGTPEENVAEAATERDVDWDFIADREGNKTDMYVPVDDAGAVLGTSGPTIGMGIDLGAWPEADLRRAGVSEELITKLKPYGGKKKQAALDYVTANPLTLTSAEVKELNKAVKGEILDTIETKFNKDSDTDFKDLTQGQQTAIASVFFQYGTNKSKKGWPKNFWRQVTEGKWDEALKNLRKFGDDYKTRRNLEADLL